MLQAFVARMQGLIRSSDVLFRYGGDEFVVLLPNTPLAQAEVLSKRILDNVRALPFPGEPALALSLSGGLAGFPAEADTPEALFEMADQRHYEAKRTGRGRIVADGPAAALFLPFDELSRIVERDQELRDVNAFVRGLAARGRAVLLLRGPDGVGRSRLLMETAKAAQLLGCEVLRVRGNPALRTRPFAALAEAWRHGRGGARQPLLPRPGWATRCKNN